MLSISSQFGKSVQDIHSLYHQVNCNRADLLKVLRAEKKKKRHDIVVWTELEDIVLKTCGKTHEM